MNQFTCKPTFLNNKNYVIGMKQDIGEIYLKILAKIKNLNNNNDNLYNDVEILFMVDVYDWAWDIAAKELIKYLPYKCKTISFYDFLSPSIDPMDFDVVIAYCLHPDVLKKLSSENTILCVGGGDFLSDQKLLLDVCKKFNIIGGVNNQIVNSLKEVNNKKRVILLTHGVDISLFKPNRHNNKVFTIGWAGRMNRKLKRFDMARRIVERSDCKFKIASQEDEYRYTHNEMPNFYNSIDCFLSTSEVEGHPLVVYEAMACGVPVITTDVGDVGEYIITGENGILVNVDSSIDSFVQHIKALEVDNNLREKIGILSRERIIRTLSWEKIAPSYLSIIEEVI